MNTDPPEGFMTRLSYINGSGLTRMSGFVHRQRNKDDLHTAVRAALLTPSVPIRKVRVRGSRLVIEVDIEDALAAAHRTRGPRKMRVVAVDRDPHGLEGQRLDGRAGPVRWW